MVFKRSLINLRKVYLAWMPPIFDTSNFFRGPFFSSYHVQQRSWQNWIHLRHFKFHNCFYVTVWSLILLRLTSGHDKLVGNFFFNVYLFVKIFFFLLKKKLKSIIVFFCLLKRNFLKYVWNLIFMEFDFIRLFFADSCKRFCMVRIDFFVS